MHGVIVEVRVNRCRGSEMRAMLAEEVVPKVRQWPGFVAGRWFQALDSHGAFAVLIFDSEEAARGFAARVASESGQAESPVWSLEAVNTYVVLARA
jgi:hypothetical protein